MDGSDESGCQWRLEVPDSVDEESSMEVEAGGVKVTDLRGASASMDGVQMAS